MDEGIDVGAMGASDGVGSEAPGNAEYLNLPDSMAPTNSGVGTGVGLGGEVEEVDIGAAVVDPLADARASLERVERELVAKQKERESENRRSDRYATLDAEVKRLQADLRSKQDALKQRERRLAPYTTAMERAEVGKADPDALVAVLGQLFSYFRTQFDDEQHDDAQLALSGMKSTMKSLMDAEAARARALNESRAEQARAIDKLVAETKDVVEKKAQSEREVARLRFAVAEAEKKLEKEDKDVESAVRAFEATTQRAMARASPKPPPQPTPKPAAEPKPTKPKPSPLRRSFSTREKADDSMVGSLFREMGLESE